MVKAEGHGIGNYVLQMAEGLAQLQKPYELLYLVDKNLPAGHPLRGHSHRDSAVAFLHPLEPFRLGKEIAKLKPALFHTPSFASLWAYPCPHVQTVHDLNHLHFGSALQHAYYAWILLPSLKNAKRVLTVSESSRVEISAWLKSQGIEKPIALAENAILPFTAAADPAFLESRRLKAGEYFFSLSNNKPFKNLALLKEAHRKSGSPFPLVISTQGESGEGILHTGPLAEAELATLLPNAKALYFPSLYEGFGRPPLEAALAGVVPVVSDIPPHREALRGVKEAIFLPREEPTAWEEKFRRPPEGKVSAESKRWIQENYSLQKLAAAMHETYTSALDSR